MMAVFCGVTALAGHIWPVYLNFRGGKGVATAAGVIFALNWMAGVIAFGVWLLFFLASRYVSLASVAAAIALPIGHVFTGRRFWGEQLLPVTIFCFAAALLVVVRHRDNLKRLLKGEEKRFHFRKQGDVSKEEGTES